MRLLLRRRDPPELVLRFCRLGVAPDQVFMDDLLACPLNEEVLALRQEALDGDPRKFLIVQESPQVEPRFDLPFSFVDEPHLFGGATAKPLLRGGSTQSETCPELVLKPMVDCCLLHGLFFYRRNVEDRACQEDLRVQAKDCAKQRLASDEQEKAKASHDCHDLPRLLLVSADLQSLGAQRKSSLIERVLIWEGWLVAAGRDCVKVICPRLSEQPSGVFNRPTGSLELHSKVCLARQWECPDL